MFSTSILTLSAFFEQKALEPVQALLSSNVSFIVQRQKCRTRQNTFILLLKNTGWLSNMTLILQI